MRHNEDQPIRIQIDYHDSRDEQEVVEVIASEVFYLAMSQLRALQNMFGEDHIACWPEDCHIAMTRFYHSITRLDANINRQRLPLRNPGEDYE